MTPSDLPPRRSFGLVALLVGGAAAWLAAMTPQPLGVDAPPAAFSAGRAMVDVRAIAAHPHPSGSAEIVQVRGHILERLRGLGVAAEVQSGEGLLTAAKAKPGVVVAGAVTNIVGVLPGRDRNAPALLIMSHYDTLPNTPGAGDDTAGTAASLEIARALKADGGHARDVIFLYTDGEEPGLLGAQAFFASNPLARHVGIAINMEARGDAGRAAMFENSAQGGALIRLFAHTSPGPSANSLMADLYHRMPNDTDLTPVLDRGVTGLNFAFAGDQLTYHTSLSTPDHLDAGSLQHMGAAVLPLARALADGAQLPGKAPDLVYSDILGRVLVAYPAAIGWGLSALAAALVATVVALVRRRGLASGRDLLRGAAALLLAALGAVLALHLAGRWLGGEDPVRVYGLVARYPLLLAGATAIALGVALAVIGAATRGDRPWLAIAAIGLALLALGRPTSAWGLWCGALVAGLALALLSQAVLPSGAFLVQWPLLLAALTAVGLLFGRIEMSSAKGAVILGVVSALGFAQVASWGSGFFVQMGPVLPELLALFVPLALLVLTPGLHALGAAGGRRWLAPILVALGAIMLVFTGLKGGPGASPRQLTQLFYYAEPGALRFHRASATNDLDPWSRGALMVDGGSPTAGKIPLISSHRLWMAPAPAVDIPGPIVTVERQAAGADEVEIVLHIRPGGRGRELKLLLQPTKALHDLTLNGRPLDTLRTSAVYGLDRLGVVYIAPPTEGITVGFRAPAHGQLKGQVLEVRDGWPEGVKPPAPRPAALLAWGLSDTTVVQSDLAYGW